MGIKSFFIFLKSLKVTFFSGWISGWRGIIYFYNDHTLAFYAIIIIILLIVVFVIYLEVNSDGNYLIRPYQILLGISLIAIVIYIIASAPEQKKLERFDYSETPKVTIDDLKYPYEDEKEWLTNDIACQNIEEEKNKYYCIEIKYQCADLLSFDQTSLFEACVENLKSKFKIGLGSFEEEFLTFKSFLLDREDTHITQDGEEIKFSDQSWLKYKPQDIAGDTLRIRAASILESSFKINEDDLRKVWSIVETQLIEEINKTIKQFYSIDNVVTNGFGDTSVPFYTRNFVNAFKRVKTSYQPTETLVNDQVKGKLTKAELTEQLQKQLIVLYDELNKVNDQINKITGHTDPSAKTILERLKIKREAIQENIFKLKYTSGNSD